MESHRTLLQRRRVESEELLLDRYRLLDTLGEGGFGTVWRAYDELLQREVAVKRIWIDPHGDSDRAAREAKATARLKHPAIVALYEAVVVDDAFYMISELIEGRTLSSLIAADELDDEEILDIGVALADALAHAHARGVIHRDIKPHNVLIPDLPEQGHGPAKLTDFGGASLAGDDLQTRSGDVFGTLAYMAPEQADGREVDERADLYSLALVLYEAFSGVNPVRGATPAATARRIGRPLPPLARHRRDLPRSLTHALDIALDPAVRERGTLDRLRLALAHAQERGLSHPRWGGPIARRVGARTEPDSDSLTVVRPALRRSGLFVPYPSPAFPSAATNSPEYMFDRSEPQPPAETLRLALPRILWVAAALAAVVWQATSGHPGVALLAAAAAAPLLVIPGEPGTSRLGWGWLGCALAPALGVIGLAGAFPAIAAQSSRWPERVAYGALGYWWLTLAQPLLSSRLWLGPAAQTPARPIWETSLQSTVTHVIGPMLTLGLLLGAALWAAAALVLPWLVRGRFLAVDLVATVMWASGLAVAERMLDSGISLRSAPPTPNGLILGAFAAGVVALGVRALRGAV